MQTQTINLSIPKPLLSMISRQAKTEARTKSGLIQEAIRVYLTRKNVWQKLYDVGQRQARKLKISPNQLEKLIDDYRQGR